MGVPVLHRLLRFLMSAATGLAVSVLVGPGFAPGPAHAQDFPSRAIHLVVGFAPGTAADLIARILAPGMSRALGQQVIVENRPGAGSIIAAEQVVRAQKDGYALLVGTVANVINGVIRPLPFDFAVDLEPVVLAGEAPNILVVPPSLGVDTVSALIALAKAKPGELTFGSSGFGTSPHVSGELFNVMAGVRIVHVPYQGSAPAMTDLLSGRISMLFSPASTAVPHIQAGTLRALASTTLKRPAIAPNLPTMNEAGLNGFETAVWFGLNAPAGTPGNVITKLARAANDALTTPRCGCRASSRQAVRRTITAAT